MIVNIRVKGAVQGVGYRPFIAEKATEYGLKGYVRNIGAAVDILVIGNEKIIDDFYAMIRSEYPAGAFILSAEKSVLSEKEYLYCLKSLSLRESDIQKDFTIVNSGELDLSTDLSVFLPDIGICDDCMKEMLDEKDRRYNYPLISCAACGPRISILDKLPYDRDTTSMKSFKMCPQCDSEYKTGRRRHAQTISCFDCGPQLELRLLKEDIILSGDSAIEEAIRLLINDKIVGLKGMSGYQLLCRPTDKAALSLRHCKGREKKPFAVMFSDIDGICEYCHCNEKEKQLLKSSARPIVLLNSKKSFPFEVCRDSRYIGAFLPSMGAHRLLCDAVGPLIVTSANKSDEPIIIDDDAFIKAFENENVDAVLFHTRRINMPQDDSVMFVVEDASGNDLSCFNRRSRGYVPFPVFLKNEVAGKKILSFGADLKNTFSLTYKDKIIPSQYLGDLKDYGVNDNLYRMIKRYCDIYHFVPEAVISDMHPLYESVRLAKEYAKANNLPLLTVQHHHAHILSVMAEKSLNSCIGIAFDGTGYGTDGNIWGGEILVCNGAEYERKGHLSYVKLCGGDNASKNAKTVKQCYDYVANCGAEIPDIISAALSNNINVFNTSSMGRLFDAVSAHLQIRDYNSFEGECAISLEKAAWEFVNSGRNINEAPELSFDIIKDEKEGFLLDQIGLYRDIYTAFGDVNFDAQTIAYSFHEAIAKAVSDICCIIRGETSENKVALSGGVFGNRLLLKLTLSKLKKEGFEVYINEMVPAGDAGISLGQGYYGVLKGI